MMKYSKALKALIDKAEQEIQKLLTDVAAGQLDKRILEAGLEQVEKDLKQMSIFNHKVDAEDESDLDPK
jgi:hypothetical protein